MENAKPTDYEAACALLAESGADFVREGADPVNAEKLMETMLGYADPEYVEAYELIESNLGHDSAMEEFKRGMGVEA